MTLIYTSVARLTEVQVKTIGHTVTTMDTVKYTLVRKKVEKLC